MITIAERLRPFSHLPGAKCLIPATRYVVEAFPTLIRIKTLEGEVVKEHFLPAEGGVRQFTLMQDLERGCVTVFCERYSVHVLPNLEIVSHKNPPLPPLAARERLSLGSHKKQDWEALKKRRDFHTLFPLWLRLGELLPLPSSPARTDGLFALLEGCKEACAARRPEQILPAFEKLFLAGFEGMLVPRASDTDLQGFVPPGKPLTGEEPLRLLVEGAALIRSLFLASSGSRISILPNLPPAFFAGRFLAAFCAPYGHLDLEWTKKMIRQLHFTATCDGEVTFHFPPDVVSCRLRVGKKGNERPFTCGDSLVIKSGSLYLLDRFQK